MLVDESLQHMYNKRLDRVYQVEWLKLRREGMHVSGGTGRVDVCCQCDG